MSERSCPVCAGTDVRRWFRKAPGRHLPDDLPVYDVLRCRACGFAFIDPVPDPATLTRVYDKAFHETSQQSIPLTDDGRIADAALERAVFRNARDRAERLARRAGENQRLLDVGCGKGVFVKAAGEFFQASGVDLSSAAVDWGQRAGLDLHHVDFLAGDLPDPPYDVVTLWDVLACLLDPHAAFARVADITRPGGLFVASFPAADALTARLLRGFWPMMIPPINVGYHTRASIDRLAARHGFRIVDYGHPGKYVETAFVWLKLKRTIGLKGERDAAGRSRPIRLNLGDIATAVLERLPDHEQD